MRFSKIVFTGIVYFLLMLVWTTTYAQSTPDAPAEIEFAGVLVQLTPWSRQRLQQALTSLYTDRGLLLHQMETLNQLRPILDARLAAEHIPLDFRYACPPFSESPYDPYAYWGLERRQAEQLRLLVNKSVDDRRHVLIATDAVLPYLNLLRQQKGHWIRALFQHLDPSVKQASTGGSTTHWLLDSHTPPAIWTILARKIAFEHEQALLKLTPTFILLEYNEGAGKTLTEIASRLKINTDKLSPYNNWLLAERIPAEGNFPVILRLNLEEYLSVKSLLTAKGARSSANNLPVANDLGFPVLRRNDPDAKRQAALFYQINGRRGIQAQLCDNAITLAYYGNLSIPAFLEMNDLQSVQDILKPGEVYYLQRKAKRAQIPFHVAQQSQTLRDISGIYGVKLKSLLRFNRLKPNQRVQVGRIIWMQRKRPARYPIEYRSMPPAEPQIPDQPAPILVAGKQRPPTDTVLAKPDTVASVSVVAKISQAASATVALPATAPKDTVSAKPPVQVARPVQVVKPAPAIAAPAVISKVHIVKPGQTYYSIAKLYGTTVAQLCAWNHLVVDDPLLVGQELLIESVGTSPVLPTGKQPVAVPVPAGKPPVPASPLPKKVQYYAVKPGETIYRIALNHGISVPDLMRWNGLKNFTIEVGQRLIISPTDR